MAPAVAEPTPSVSEPLKPNTPILPVPATQTGVVSMFQPEITEPQAVVEDQLAFTTNAPIAPREMPIIQMEAISTVRPVVIEPPGTAEDQPVTATHPSPVLLTKIEDKSARNVVYSDGACKGNGKPGSIAGIGVWWGKNDPRSVLSQFHIFFLPD